VLGVGRVWQAIGGGGHAGVEDIWREHPAQQIDPAPAPFDGIDMDDDSILRQQRAAAPEFAGQRPSRAHSLERARGAAISF
jgi:hypothetical protein